MAKAKDKNENLSERKSSRDLDKLREKTRKSQLSFSDLIIPLGSLGILVLLTIFVFMPMIKTATKYRKELKVVKEDIEHLENVESSLKEIDDTKIIDDLLIAKRIIPNILQVADFTYYIDELGQSKELETSEIKVGDVTFMGGNISGVSSSLSYTGEYDNILDFVDEIQGYSPYLVVLEGFELSMGSDGTWEVEFRLTGYYIEESEKVANFSAPFTKYTNFSDIIDIFSVKVEKLDEI